MDCGDCEKGGRAEAYFSGSLIVLFYILRPNCAPIVWGFQWRLRITCGFAGLWKRRTWPVSSSDCVGISGEVEDCMRICRIVWREVKRGEERWEWSVEGDVPSGWRSLKMNRQIE